MGAPVCHGSDWSECHADINSDTAAVIRVTIDLAKPFSMIAKEQSSLMDYGGMMYSIHPFWMVRFATIVQSSFPPLADSIFWIVRPLAVVSQTAMKHDLPSLWKSETMWAWYHWITSLVARNGSEMTYRWLAASEQWTAPNFRAFIPRCSFPRVEQSTSLRSIQMEG